MKVLKFGGSSLGNSERVMNAANIVKGVFGEVKELVVVVSAFGGVTNVLAEMAEKAAGGNKEYLELFETLKGRHSNVVEELLGNDAEVGDYVDALFHELQEVLHGVYLIKELTAKTKDYVFSFGERLSARIFAERLVKEGIEAGFLDAREVIKTDRKFGRGRVDFEMTEKLVVGRFEKSKGIQVVTGFIASTKDDETITLGRDGSDYTASILASVLGAKAVEIWTDVDGVMTCNPKKVTTAFPIAQMTYEEAMEMSHFGAEVIHPPTLQPALKNNIPIWIKNSLNPTFPGTLINGSSESSQYVVKGITSIDNISLLQVQGSILIENNTKIYERLFRAFSKEMINIVMISQASSERSICFAVSPEAAIDAKRLLDEEFEMEMKMGYMDPVLVQDNLSTVAIVGSNMKNTVGVSAKLFNALADAAVSAVAIAQGSSELNISVVINKRDEVTALNAIHDTFFFKD